jgi:Glycosyl transferase family 2
MNDSIDISVVVAAVNAAETLRPWLDAVRPQAAGRRVEVLLAASSDDAAVDAGGSEEFVRVVRGPAGALVPELWGAALLEARGTIVAVTITACVPEADWLDAIAAAYRDGPADGIGGVIDCRSDAGVEDRALHLVRYTPYLPPLTAGPVLEIAGDNGTYRRAALDQWRGAIERDGFWESEFNRHIRAGGGLLRIDPSIRVTHTRSYSFGAFTLQRFRHGRIFGRARRGAMPLSARVVRAAISPAVPAIMLLRAVGTVSSRHRFDGRAMAASVLAYWYFWCWALGEDVGLIFG